MPPQYFIDELAASNEITINPLSIVNFSCKNYKDYRINAD